MLEIVEGEAFECSGALRLMGPERGSVCAECWPAWVRLVGQKRGLIPCRCHWPDQGVKTALVLRELQSQDAGERLSTDPS